MRELSREEIGLVSGGITISAGSFSIGHPLGAIPVLSIQFEGNHGILTVAGVSTPFGEGLPSIRLP